MRDGPDWTCPNCQRSWTLAEGEPPVPAEASRCPECGEPPSGFSQGQVVWVTELNTGRERLGVLDDPVQAGCPDPEEPGLLRDCGPFTGEFMVFHLSHGYGSADPVEPEAEREVFANLPLDSSRRLALAHHFMTGFSAPPSRIRALSPAEAAEFGYRG